MWNQPITYTKLCILCSVAMSSYGNVIGQLVYLYFERANMIMKGLDMKCLPFPLHGDKWPSLISRPDQNGRLEVERKVKELALHGLAKGD